MEIKPISLIVVGLVALLILNITLLALGKIKELFFWAVIIAAAIFAYKILPKIRK